MKKNSLKLLTEKENLNEISELENRMNNFYNTTTSYIAFEEVSSHDEQWSNILKYIAENNKISEKVKILEIGAGKSGLGEFLRSKGVIDQIELTFHDVTTKNIEWLKQFSDRIIIGDIEMISDKFDIVVHSYVLEHVSRPVCFLRYIYNNLTKAGGINIIECPRYDFPFYLPNSLNHCSLLVKIKVKLTMIFSRNTNFLVNDPAVFNLPFYRDVDAIHLVRKKEICRLFPDGKISTWNVRSLGFRHWILNRFLTCRLIIEKRSE